MKKLAHSIEPIFQVGKAGVTPEVTSAINDALEARELIKINVLKNCIYEPKEVGITLSERTRSEMVMAIGRKVILYRESKENPEIKLPK